MKKAVLFFLLFILNHNISIGAFKLTGHIANHNPKYYLTIIMDPGYIGSKKNVIVQPDELGKFSIDLEISNPQFLTIRYSDSTQVGMLLYVEPNMDLTIQFNAQKIAITKKFLGGMANENEVLQDFRKLNSLSNRFKIRTTIYEFQLPQARLYLDSIRNRNKMLINEYKGTVFHKAMTSEIDYIWAEDQLLKLIANHDSKDSKNYAFLDEISFYPITYSTSYNFHNYFISWYFIGLSLKNNQTTIHDRNKVYYQLIDETLNRWNKEYLHALIVKDEINTSSNAKELVSRFKNEYPGSAFSYYFDSLIQNKNQSTELFELIGIDPSQIKSAHILINFWASWCKPCLAQIPYYNTLEQKYPKEKFLLINVNMDDNDKVDKAKQIVGEKNFLGSHIYLSENEITQLETDFEIRSLPRKILIQKGKILIYDLIELEQLEEIIK